MSAVDEAISLLRNACLAANDGDRSPFNTAARAHAAAAVQLAADAIDEVLASPAYTTQNKGRTWNWSARDIEVLDDARQLLKQRDANPTTTGASL